jgi:hypothetical protein
VRAVEMEASGIADAAWTLEIGYFVVRGISDYCDKNKNDVWRYYAAAVSAAYCRALLEEIAPPIGHPSVEAGSELLAITEPTQSQKSSHRQVAEQLLLLSQPKSVASLFQTTGSDTAAAIAKLAGLVRTVHDAALAQPTPQPLVELVGSMTSPQLVLGPSGIGKTFSVWAAARQLLTAGKLVPIFLPAGDMSSTRQVEQYIDTQLEGGIRALRNDPDVIFVVDGWTDFPRGADGPAMRAERRALLALLGNGRIIATGRPSGSSEQGFAVWQLDPLPGRRVVEILAIGLPLAPSPAAEFLDLLKQPLLLLLHLLLRGSSETSAGALLLAFHRHVSGAHHAPDNLLAALSSIALRLTLRGEGLSRSAFDREVGLAARTFGLQGLAGC